MSLQAMRSSGLDPHDPRSAARRNIRLEVHGSSTYRTLNVLVHNVSTTGILVECSGPIKLDETIQFEFPHAGQVEAIVKWSNDGYVGCEFVRSLSPAAISAFLLKSSFNRNAASQDPLSDDTSVVSAGMSDAVISSKEQTDRFPPRMNVLIIVGLSAATWSALGALAWLFL